MIKAAGNSRRPINTRYISMLSLNLPWLLPNSTRVLRVIDSGLHWLLSVWPAWIIVTMVTENISTRLTDGHSEASRPFTNRIEWKDEIICMLKEKMQEVDDIVFPFQHMVLCRYDFLREFHKLTCLWLICTFWGNLYNTDEIMIHIKLLLKGVNRLYLFST